MRSKCIVTTLILSAACLTFTNAQAGFPAPNVNVQVTGFLPAPPGVFVQMDAGRPYYVEHDRRIYMEKERPGKHHKHKKEKHHGNKYGHYKEDKGDRGEHRGGGHGH